MPSGTDASVGLSATAIASRSDGLSYAIGTSTGHTLLYDIRSPRPYAMKDQGYGLPVKCVEWVEGGNRVAGDGMVISADKKVVKLWDRNSVSTARNLLHTILTCFAGQYKLCISDTLCRYKPLAPRPRLWPPHAC